MRRIMMSASLMALVASMAPGLTSYGMESPKLPAQPLAPARRYPEVVHPTHRGTVPSARNARRLARKGQV